uniref:Uncharacterized protein n=1 Tax=Rhizophora mucronata TaxID=61149 RepID=A0A2P2P6W9_RHIMU
MRMIKLMPTTRLSQVHPYMTTIRLVQFSLLLERKAV